MNFIIKNKNKNKNSKRATFIPEITRYDVVLVQPKFHVWFWQVHAESDSNTCALSFSATKHPPFFNIWFLHLCRSHLFRSHLFVIYNIKTEMGSFFSHSFTKEQLEMALVKAKAIVNSNPVVVFRFFSSPFKQNSINPNSEIMELIGFWYQINYNWVL